MATTNAQRPAKARAPINVQRPPSGFRGGTGTYLGPLTSASHPGRTSWRMVKVRPARPMVAPSRAARRGGRIINHVDQSSRLWNGQERRSAHKEGRHAKLRGSPVLRREIVRLRSTFAKTGHIVPRDLRQLIYALLRPTLLGVGDRLEPVLPPRLPPA